MSRVAERFVLLISFLSLIGLCSAQIDTNPDSSSLSANAIVLHMLQRSGWTNLPADAVAVGKVRDPNFPDAAPGLLSVSARGWNQIRIDNTRNGKSTGTVINKRRAMRTSGAEKGSLSLAFALSSRIPVFPFFTIITKPAAVRAAKWIGTEPIGTDIADVVEIFPQTDPADISSPIREKTEHYKLWVSRSTGLLLQISYVRLPTYD